MKKAFVIATALAVTHAPEILATRQRTGNAFQPVQKSPLQRCVAVLGSCTKPLDYLVNNRKACAATFAVGSMFLAERAYQLKTTSRFHATERECWAHDVLTVTIACVSAACGYVAVKLAQQKVDPRIIEKSK